MGELAGIHALEEARRNGTAPPLEAEPRTLPEVVETFGRWLYLPDPAVVYAVAGAVAANLLDGDPVWLLVIGPPGGGKSETLQATAGLPNVHPTATLTEAALLSGSSKRERAADARGGLLRAVGDFGLVVCKDFGSVLNIRREERAAVLAALREVYDGSWTRHVGTDGGRTLTWRGKLGFLGGATPTIDRHHGALSALGERFTYFRLPEADADEQARRSLAHAGHEVEMRAELQAALSGLFHAGAPGPPRELSDAEREQLVRLAALAVRARSAVERDGYSREVELVPGAESPTRLVKALERMLAGLDVIGLERERAWRVVTKCARDSIPALRLAAVDALMPADELTTTQVAEAVSHPTLTSRRALEDLTAHGVVRRLPGGKGKPDNWTLTEWTRQRYVAATFSEMSEGANGGTFSEMSGGDSSLFISPLTTKEDISEKVAEHTDAVPASAADEAELKRAQSKFGGAP